MNFWERKVHGAFKCNLTFLTWQIRGSALHKSILQQMFEQNVLSNLKSHSDADASYTLGGTFHTILSEVKEELLS